MVTSTEATQKLKEWEMANVLGNGYISKHNNGTARQIVQRQGYDAVRISPRVTTKHGKQYRAVYAAWLEEVVSKYSPPVRNKKGQLQYPCKAHWDLRGYVKASVKPGTTAFATAKSGNFIPSSLKSQLMLK